LATTPPRLFGRAGAAAIDAIAAIARQTQADCGFHWTPGYLHASMRDKEATERQRLEQDAELARAFGFNATFVEHVLFANCCGVHFPHQAKFHPLKYLKPLVISFAIFDPCEVFNPMKMPRQAPLQ
jgi:hypothetical protein